MDSPTEPEEFVKESEDDTFDIWEEISNILVVCINLLESKDGSDEGMGGSLVRGTDSSFGVGSHGYPGIPRVC